ncbi:hypothetical protein C0J52_24035 [Blattella germanica]|nr:hypothetical protein C0J52_24035 [Blattella germanica]
MAKPGGKFVGYQDLTREEIRELMINSFLDDYKLVILPGGRIFFTLERLQRSNCIVRCYLKTTEVVLQEIKETCPYIHEIDELIYLGMQFTEELMTKPRHQFPTIINFYKQLFQGVLAYHCISIKSTVFNRLISVLFGCIQQLHSMNYSHIDEEREAYNLRFTRH